MLDYIVVFTCPYLPCFFLCTSLAPLYPTCPYVPHFPLCTPLAPMYPTCPYVPHLPLCSPLAPTYHTCPTYPGCSYLPNLPLFTPLAPIYPTLPYLQVIGHLLEMEQMHEDYETLVTSLLDCINNKIHSLTPLAPIYPTCPYLPRSPLSPGDWAPAGDGTDAGLLRDSRY